MEKNTLDSDTQALVRLCHHVLSEKKAEAIQVWDVRGLSSLYDVVILASGTANPHLAGILKALETEVRTRDIPVCCYDFAQNSGWALLDLYRVVVHVLLPEKRQYYWLEGLWAKAPELDPKQL
jgi:ribosome-associated protein